MSSHNIKRYGFDGF